MGLARKRHHSFNAVATAGAIAAAHAAALEAAHDSLEALGDSEEEGGGGLSRPPRRGGGGNGSRTLGRRPRSASRANGRASERARGRRYARSASPRERRRCLPRPAFSVAPRPRAGSSRFSRGTGHARSSTVVAAARSVARPRRAAPTARSRSRSRAVAATAPPVVVVAEPPPARPRRRLDTLTERNAFPYAEPRSLRVAAARVAHRADVRVRPAEGDVVVRAPPAAAGGALPDTAPALGVVPDSLAGRLAPSAPSRPPRSSKPRAYP